MPQAGDTRLVLGVAAVLGVFVLAVGCGVYAISRARADRDKEEGVARDLRLCDGANLQRASVQLDSRQPEDGPRELERVERLYALRVCDETVARDTLGFAPPRITAQFLRAVYEGYEPIIRGNAVIRGDKRKGLVR